MSGKWVTGPGVNSLCNYDKCCYLFDNKTGRNLIWL